MNNSKTLNSDARTIVQGRDCLEDPQSRVSEKIRVREDKFIQNDKRCSRVARRWNSASLRLRRLRS